MEDHEIHETDQATVSENIEVLFETIKDYGQTNIDLVKLKAADRISDIVSSLVANFLVLLALSMFIVVLNIGIALLLGEVLGKSYYGFFVLAGFYLIVGLIFNSQKTKWFQTPIGDMLVKKIFK
ncbi:MAG: hypothetical protein ABIT58_09710 [Ferruginibacter sp.]